MRLPKSIELMGRRWSILQRLSQRKYYVSELAKELGKSPPEISKNLKELEENGLVRWEQKGGLLKYYYVSDYAKRFLTAVSALPARKPKEKLEVWQINEFLDILEDPSLSEDLRLFYSNSFHDICDRYPIEVVSHNRARTFFEEIVADPLRDKVREDLKRSVSAVLPYALRHVEWKNWVLEKLYPVFVENVENKNGEIRVWVVTKIGQIASIESSVKHKTKDKFLEIWFSDDTDPDSKIGKEVKQKLVDLASKSLFEDVRSKARNQDVKVKAKAEILLKGLKNCLQPK